MKINKIEQQGEKVIEKMIERMVAEKGVPEEKVEAEIERINDVLNDRVMDEILTALPTETLKEIEGRAGDAEFSEEEFEKIVRGAGIKLESVAEKVMNDFREDYLGVDDEEMEEER